MRPEVLMAGKSVRMPWSKLVSLALVKKEP